MLVMVSGNLTDLSFSHELKVESPILVMVEGIMTEVISSQSLNAPSTMPRRPVKSTLPTA